MFKNLEIDILYYICTCIDFLYSVLSKFYEEFYSFFKADRKVMY